MAFDALEWRKSSRSASKNDECVEVALKPDTAFVRDSKCPDFGRLRFEPDQWHGFIQVAKAGDLS